MKKGLPQRRSVRLPSFDYGGSGSYFVTVCSHERKHLFGFIHNGIMCLNNLGQLIWQEWKKTFQMRPHFSEGAFIVMPNHWHGIVKIIRPDHESGVDRIETFGGSKSDTLASMMRGMQSAITSRAKNEYGFTDKLFQRSYYDHVIRDVPSYWRIHYYILNNPKNWKKDCFLRNGY